MFVSKFKYKIRKALNLINGFKSPLHFNFSWRLGALIVTAGFITTLLLTNIYSSIKDIEKYRILNQEEQKLDSLKEENYELIQKREFYNSKYYQRLYSREALNMAEPDQEIFYIERRNIYDYDKMTDMGEKIDLQNFKMWWIRLIL